MQYNATVTMIPVSTGIYDCSIKDGWTLRFTEYKQLSGDEFGTRYMAAGQLVKGDRSIRVEGFVGRTQEAARRSLRDSAAFDVDHTIGNW